MPPFAETFSPPNSFEPPTPRLYHAAVPGQVYPAAVVIRVRGGDDPARFAQKFREITATVDPTLKLERIDECAPDVEFRQALLLADGCRHHCRHPQRAAPVGGRHLRDDVVHCLSAAPRDRHPLGPGCGHASHRSGIFGRAGAQLGAGIAAGLAMAVAFEWLGPGGTMGGHGLVILPSVVAVMFTVGLLTAVGPARCGLAVQPTEALREE